MNILILNWRDPKHPLAGGAEISLHRQINYWQKKGAKVTWFASHFPKAKKEEVVDNITIIRNGTHKTVFFWFAYYYLLGKFKSSEVIIDCFHFVPFFTPLFARNKKIIALIHEVAGLVWFHNLPYVIAYIGYKLEPFFFYVYRNTPFITVSESTMNDLVQNNIKKSNIIIVPNGTEVFKLRKKITKEENPRLVFLGRLSKDKGIEDALLALQVLSKEFNNIYLDIVGKAEKDDYKKYIQDLVKNLGIKKNCRFFGFVTDSQKAEILAKAWILVHPSIREGWGLNVIEANSLGTPAVGYDVAGLRDSIVNNKTGLLVKPDPQSLADGIKRLISDKKGYQRMQLEAKEWSENFSWEASGKKSFEYIKKIANE